MGLSMNDFWRFNPNSFFQVYKEWLKLNDKYDYETEKKQNNTIKRITPIMKGDEIIGYK